jgi:hypothetical protein
MTFGNVTDTCIDQRMGARSSSADPVEDQVAGTGPEKARCDTEERRLAGTVGAEQSNDTCLGHCKIHTPEHCCRSVPSGHSGKLEHQLAMISLV